MKRVFVILDRSGSMSSVQDATISGFNEYLDGLKKEKSVRFNLTLFDDQFEYPIKNKPIKHVEHLTRETFVPRGLTALYDGVCKTINENKETVKDTDKALVVIMTDGGENASQEYKTEDFRKLVKELEAKGNWTFVFMGANQDSWANASQWGFKQGNVANYNSTHLGSTVAFSTMAAATGQYMRSASLTTQDFYSSEDKTKMENAK